MKIKDYWRLAKISLKARKKETRNTVIGIAFSLIIIVPLMFTIIGINNDILKKVNAQPNEIYANFVSISGESSKDKISHHGDKGYFSLYGYPIVENYFNDFVQKDEYFDNDSDLFTYTIHKNNTGHDNSYERIEYNGKKYRLNKMICPKDSYGNEMDVRPAFGVITTKNMKTINSYLKEYCKEGFIGFTGTGQSQVVIGEKYLKACSLNADEIIGKEISVFYGEGYEGSNYTMLQGPESAKTKMSTLDHHLFKNFKVVGILKDFGTSSRDLRAVSMYFTSASYYKDGKVVLGPKFGKYNYKENTDDKQGYAFYYKDLDEMEKLSSLYVYPGSNSYSNIEVQRSNGNNESFEPESIVLKISFLKSSDYNTLDKKFNKISKEVYGVAGMEQVMLKTMLESPAISNLAMITTIVNLAMVVGGIFGGVILFAALVNLFNSVKHSVDSRRNYLGVMEAIGAKRSTIPKLYLFEVIRIFTRAYLRILIVGSAICFGVMVAFYYLSIYTPIQFTISWTLIPVVMGIVAVILIVVGIIYSLICTYSISKKPITELLEA